jgi:hypothetical protein
VIEDTDMRLIDPQVPEEVPSANHVSSGLPLDKQLRIQIFSPEEWESFVEEWASSQEASYQRVRRFGGAGDMGVDVAGYVDDAGLQGAWDNFQCKRYASALSPSMVAVEFGKIIYYSFQEEYTPPRRYFFAAPKGVGTTLSKLLDSPDELKENIKGYWDRYCREEITKKEEIKLEGELLEYFENFDFSIFNSKSVVEMIKDHSETPFHAVRFGGGLKPRPRTPSPPKKLDELENRYLEQIFDACSDHIGERVRSIADIKSSSKPSLSRTIERQRERFFNAEALRSFARDNVPPGTFSDLQDEVFDGTIDTCESEHPDGLTRMEEVLKASTNLQLTANPLISVTHVKDRQGICHQLANDNKLVWVPQEEERDGS